MSVENVQKFFELVKSNEELAQEIERIKNEAQNKAGAVDYEQIISKNVIPMAKEHGLGFTLEDFLKYSSSIAQQGELSDDDLLNVSGGWSGSQMLATGLMLLTLGSSGLSIMGNLQGSGGSDNGTSTGSAPTSSYSYNIDKNDTNEASVASEDTILPKAENLNTGKSSEDVSNEADEVIENNAEESDIADEDNGSTEDVSFNEESAVTASQESATEATEDVSFNEDDGATTAQKDATEATEEEAEIETNDEAIDVSSRLGYEDLDANNKELKDVSIDWTEKDNDELEDFFAEDENNEEAENEVTEADELENKEENTEVDLGVENDEKNEAQEAVSNEENENNENNDIEKFDNFNNEAQILNFDDVDEDDNDDFNKDDDEVEATTAEEDFDGTFSELFEENKEQGEASNEADAEKDEATAKVKYESWKKTDDKSNKLSKTLVNFISYNNIKSLDDIEEGSRDAFKNDVLKLKSNLTKNKDGSYNLGKGNTVEKAGDNGPYSVMYNIIQAIGG